MRPSWTRWPAMRRDGSRDPKTGRRIGGGGPALTSGGAPTIWSKPISSSKSITAGISHCQASIAVTRPRTRTSSWHPYTVGHKPLAIRLFNRYLDGVGLAAREHESVRRTLVEVAQLIRPISDFFQPAIAAAVGKTACKAGLRLINGAIFREPIAPI